MYNMIKNKTKTIRNEIKEIPREEKMTKIHHTLRLIF